MKRVVSVSLGSSKRNHAVTQEFGGHSVTIERIGTDGDKRKAINLIRELDGKVDAFGLGGTDLYIYAGGKRYTFRESVEIAAAARETPIVDGSGIKNTLERRVVSYVEKKQGIPFAGRKALVVCAVDRFGLAEAMVESGAVTTFGDLLFGLGLPLPITTLQGLGQLARIAAPIITQLPISLFYPTGDKQNITTPRFERYFNEAEIIAGDFHFIRRFMPLSLPGKIIITNTVTAEDEKLLKERGVDLLVTTTPEMGGRSFGTNTLEAVLVAIAGKRPEQIDSHEYSRLISELSIEPRIKRLS